MTSRSSSFDSLPQDIRQQLCESADCLVRAMKIPGSRAEGTDFNVANFLPDLFEIYSMRLSERGSSAEIVRHANSFARSLETFARYAMQRGFFRQLVPTRQVIACAYDAFCVSGDAFFQEGRTYGNPPVQSYIKQLTERRMITANTTNGPSIPPEEWVGAEGAATSARVIDSLRTAVVSFRGAAMLPMYRQELHDYARRMEDLYLERAQLPGISNSSIIISYFNGRTLIAYQAMMAEFERWFVIDLAEQLERTIECGRKARDEGDIKAFQETAHGLVENITSGVNGLEQMRKCVAHLENLLEQCRQNNVRVASIEIWDALRLQLIGFCHAYSNILGELFLIGHALQSENAMREERALALLDEMPYLRLSRLDSMINLVHRLLGRKAEQSHVDFQLGSIPSIYLPPSIRVEALRAVEEMARNSVKYSDSSKPEPFVRVEARMEGAQLLVQVFDNGLGIRRVERALAGGWREHPDVAEGSGRGLQSLVALAKGNGWSFDISSSEGKWTRAELRLPTASSEGVSGDSEKSDTTPPESGDTVRCEAIDLIVPDISLFPLAFGGVRSR